MTLARYGLGAALVLSGISLFPAAAHAQLDSDGDGVIDSADAFPCDATAAGEAYAPARGTFAMLMMEDRFPAGGDYDFNDVVVAYNIMTRTDGSGRTSAIRLNLRVLAAGGMFENGLGWHLPLPASAIASVTRTIGAGAATPLSPRSDGEYTVTLLDNIREVLGGAAGPINSLPTAARVDGQTVQIDITLSNPTTLSMGLAPWDLFAFRVGETSREIHLSRYAGTAAMNAALFNTADDRSTNGRWFVDQRGVPFVLTLPSVVSYPQEEVGIDDLYPDIIPFAASAGATNQNFYATNVISSARYLDNQSRGVATPSLAVDRFTANTSCVPVYTPGTSSFVFSGAVQTFVVPAAVTSINVVARGAVGGTVDSLRQGGWGGQVSATLAVTPGETLYVYVGGAGGLPASGFNGGGYGGSSSSWHGGGGGGASDIRRGTALSGRVIVAGGGGGGGVGPGSRQHGGAGGTTNGAAGQSSSSSIPGGGGTQGAGGFGGTSGYNGALGPYPGSAGALGQGGVGGAFTGSTPRGGGGGGGYYGGGGGGVYYCCGQGGAGGGGGSSCTAPTGVTNVVHTAGVNVGYGDVTITW